MELEDDYGEWFVDLFDSMYIIHSHCYTNLILIPGVDHYASDDAFGGSDDDGEAVF